MGPPPRPRGRPRRPVDDVKRHVLGIRTTRALKDAVVKASKASGRSLTEEVEYRLARSFEEDDRDREMSLAEIRIDSLVDHIKNLVMGCFEDVTDDFRAPVPVVLG